MCEGHVHCSRMTLYNRESADALARLLWYHGAQGYDSPQRTTRAGWRTLKLECRETRAQKAFSTKDEKSSSFELTSTCQTTNYRCCSCQEFANRSIDSLYDEVHVRALYALCPQILTAGGCLKLQVHLGLNRQVGNALARPVFTKTKTYS